MAYRPGATNAQMLCPMFRRVYMLLLVHLQLPMHRLLLSSFLSILVEH